MVVQALSCNFEQLLSFFFATSQYTFHAFLRMPFHCHQTKLLFSRELSPTPVIFQLFLGRFVIRTSFCVPQCSRSICIHVKYIPSASGQGMRSVLQDQPPSSMSSTQDQDSAFFQQFFKGHPRIPIRIILVFDGKEAFPIRHLFPSKFH